MLRFKPDWIKDGSRDLKSMSDVPQQDFNREKNANVYGSLLNWISTRTGLTFRGQEDHALRIILQCEQDQNCSGPTDLRRVLQANRGAFEELVGQLSIGETYFFRDHRQFAAIRDEFIPAIRSARPATHQIRVWSAGCASGEEAWSLAMVFAEKNLQRQSRILATDISRQFLKRAEAATYRNWSMRGDAELLANRWLRKTDGHYSIQPELRGNVDFAYLNLAEDHYPSRENRTAELDLILCRNVLIYFDDQTIAAVAKRFFRCLAPGGWLVTGASDPPLHRFAPFDVLMTVAGPVLTRTAPEELRKRPLRANSFDVTFKADVGEKLTGMDLKPAGGVSQKSSDSTVSSDSGKDSRLNSCQETLNLPDRIRETAEKDPTAAERICAEAVREYRTNTELHYLHATVLTELNRSAEAVDAARRVVFLDRDLLMGHILLATTLVQTGDKVAARRSFRNARRLCDSLPPAQIVPLSDGETAAQIAESIDWHLRNLPSS